MKRFVFHQRAAATICVLTASRYQHDRSGKNKGPGFASRSKRSYQNPLAQRDPSTRNIAIPESVHVAARVEDTLTAEAQQKAVNHQLALQMQQRLVWEGTVIDNKDHELVQHFVRLRTNPKYRNSKNLMVVSGRELLEELAGSGNHPKHLLIPADQDIPDWARKDKTEIVKASRSVLDACDSGNDGFIGDFSVPVPPPKEELIANVHELKNVLVLDNVTDSGNLGTLLRTAAGFAYDAVITTNHCADIYSHSVVRAARGAHFQKTTPFYALREEDGDDVYGMLNHVIKRNSMQPLVCSPKSVEGGDVAAKKEEAADEPSDASKRLAMSLNQYCMHSMLGKGKDTTKSDQRTAHMIIASDDTSQSLHRRLDTRLKKPTITLALEEHSPDPTATDLVPLVSTTMYQLRASAAYDYLPAEHATDESSMDLQTQFMNSPLGTQRDHKYLKPNLDEEEQLELAYEKMKEKKASRMRRYRRSDATYWADNEKQQIMDMARQEKELRMNPLARLDPDYKPRKKKNQIPDHIGNWKHESHESMGRDELREEAELAKEGIKSTLYDSQMHYDPRQPKGYTRGE